MLRPDSTGSALRGLPAALPPVSRQAFRHFARRFREAYGATYPLDGAGLSWPRSSAWGESGASLPSRAANLDALAALEAKGVGLAETKARIDRIFEHAEHRAAGISLARVVAWWPSLAAEKRLDSRTRAVAGAL